MKNIFFLCVLVLAGTQLVSCDDDGAAPPPVQTELSITTAPAEGITFTSAMVKADLVVTGATITDCGFVWNTEPNPTLSVRNIKFGAKSGEESLSHTLTDLEPNTTYHFRSFYITESATVYSEDFSFTTLRHSEFVAHAASAISFTEASISGDLTIFDDEVFECGFVWGKKPNPTTATADKYYFGPQAESTTLSFKLVGLDLDSHYYFRSYVITPSGVLYGEEQSFKTLAEIVWTEPGGFPGGARMAAISFVIGDKAYVGLGHGRDEEDHLIWYKDMWEFDMTANTWTQRENYPGAGSSGAVGFAINGKGYVGTGSGPGGAVKDFWEFDPETNSWTEKATFIGSSVSYATGFSLDGKGYLGTGVENGNGNFLKTFYQYDPQLNQWTKKADFPGLAVDQAIGFSLGEYGYIGMGLRMESWLGHTKQLWAYLPASDTWTQKKDCPSPQSLDGSLAFTLNGKAYVGLGWGNGTTIWKYDPDLNEWQDDGAVTKSRISAVAIPLDNEVMIGTGASSSEFFKDFENYTPQ